MNTERETVEGLRNLAVDQIESVGIQLSKEEKKGIEVLDFGLSHIETEGAQIATLVSSEKVALKAIVLQPYQIEPEHWHPPIDGHSGKEETLRCMAGKVIVGISGEANPEGEMYLPTHNREHYTCQNIVVLQPGEQILFKPGEKHWFRAWDTATTLLSISSTAVDIQDKFTNPNIIR